MKRGEKLCDLGGGDGRIVVTAAQRYGARGVDIDLNPQHIREARAIFEADLFDANVVTLYLQGSINRRLRAQLWRQLRVGSRRLARLDMGPERPSEHRESVSSLTVYTWTVTQQNKNAVRGVGAPTGEQFLHRRGPHAGPSTPARGGTVEAH